MISLVLPAYNPGELVSQTWHAVREFLRARPDPWEVLIVCDGCTDGTPARLAELEQTSPDSRIRVLSYEKNRGKGYAVRLGLLNANGDWRVFTDIDLAYNFSDVARIADELRNGASVAIASREHPESIIQLSPQYLGYAYRRRLQSKVFGTAARLLLPIRQYDTQAGLKGLTAQVAELILPLLRCDGFGFDCELLTACARYNIPVQEVPVCVQYHDAASSTGGIRTIWKMLRELQTIRKMWPRAGYPAPISTVGTVNSEQARAA